MCSLVWLFIDFISSYFIYFLAISFLVHLYYTTMYVSIHVLRLIPYNESSNCKTKQPCSLSVLLTTPFATGAWGSTCARYAPTGKTKEVWTRLLFYTERKCSYRREERRCLVKVVYAVPWSAKRQARPVRLAFRVFLAAVSRASSCSVVSCL